MILMSVLSTIIHKAYVNAGHLDFDIIYDVGIISNTIIMRDVAYGNKFNMFLFYKRNFHVE